jgi:hypothetical protein
MPVSIINRLNYESLDGRLGITATCAPFIRGAGFHEDDLSNFLFLQQ